MEIRTEKMLTAEQRRRILERIMAHYGMNSQAEFGRFLGISAQNINSWLTKGTYNVELLAVSLPEISGDWLLTGEEPMLKADRVAKSTEDVPPQQCPADAGELHRALEALAAEQRLTAKAQEQADKILSIMQLLATSVNRLKRSSE